MRLINLLPAVLLAVSCSRGSEFRNADLLFIAPVGQNSEMENAIETATGDSLDSYTHVAIIEVNDNGTIYTIDASPKYGVARHTLRQTIIDNSGSDGTPPIMTLYRLRSSEICLTKAVERAKSYIGQPYDFTFMPDNGAVYCSELVWLSYLDDDGNPLFDTVPMNFLDTDGTLPVYWKNLFARLSIPIPQGIPGTNPTQLSRSPILRKVRNLH